MERILIFTATYNEAGNIGVWIDEVHEAAPSADLLIVDDNSPDGTREVILAQRDSGLPVTLIERPGKLGLGSAHKLAFQYALAKGYDVLVTMDADLSHRATDIPPMLDAIADHDFVIGTRAVDGYSMTPGVRKFLSSSANSVTSRLLPTGLSEYTTSLRAFRRSSLEVLCASDQTARGYAFFIECIETLHGRGLDLAEVPIVFMDRRHGQSKIPRNQIVWTGALLMRLKARRMLGRDGRVSPAVSGDVTTIAACPACGSGFIDSSHDGKGGERSTCLMCGDAVLTYQRPPETRIGG